LALAIASLRRGEQNPLAGVFHYWIILFTRRRVNRIFEQKIERPSPAREERILNFAHACIEDLRYQTVAGKMSAHHKQSLDALLKSKRPTNHALSM